MQIPLRIRIRNRLFHWIFLLKRPVTLGVRILVRDDEGRVLLVRHGYVPGWYLPGGGVERGETAEEAARKELLEETGIATAGPLQLISVHANRTASARDHVLLYACPDWRRERPFEPNLEIAEIGFFDPDKLPETTTPATRARLGEIIEGQGRSAYW